MKQKFFLTLALYTLFSISVAAMAPQLNIRSYTTTDYSQNNKWAQFCIDKPYLFFAPLVAFVGLATVGGYKYWKLHQQLAELREKAQEPDNQSTSTGSTSSSSSRSTSQPAVCSSCTKLKENLTQAQKDLRNAQQDLEAEQKKLANTQRELASQAQSTINAKNDAEKYAKKFKQTRDVLQAYEERPYIEPFAEYDLKLLGRAITTYMIQKERSEREEHPWNEYIYSEKTKEGGTKPEAYFTPHRELCIPSKLSSTDQIFVALELSFSPDTRKVTRDIAGFIEISYFSNTLQIKNLFGLTELTMRYLFLHSLRSVWHHTTKPTKLTITIFDSQARAQVDTLWQQTTRNLPEAGFKKEQHPVRDDFSVWSCIVKDCKDQKVAELFGIQ